MSGPDMLKLWGPQRKVDTGNFKLRDGDTAVSIPLANEGNKENIR
jgi:hypothetical protein